MKKLKSEDAKAMKKKVTLLCQYFYPEYVSSATLPKQLAEELASNGYEVNVICGLPQENNYKNVPKKEEYKGIKIKRLKYGSFNNENKVGRIINFFSFFSAALTKLPTIMKQDVVIVYSNPPILPLIGYWAQKFGKVKLAFIGFDLYPDNAIALNAIKQNGVIHKIMNYINKRVYSHSQKIVAISSDMKSYMLSTHTTLNEERTVIIPNWYTGNLMKSDDVKKDDFKMLRNSYKLIVLYTGNMGEAQELDTIADSIIKMSAKNKSKDILFIFTGHGSKRAIVENKLKENKIDNVKFYGFLQGQDYIDILNIADVCLVSLKKGIEGLGVPSKTYGYFAYGKPIISIMSNETELAHNIISNRAGYNVKQGDINEFINAVESFVEKPELLIKYGENSLKLHENYYKKEISLKKYRNLIDELSGMKKENINV